jgi:hypothetical protein
MSMASNFTVPMRGGSSEAVSNGLALYCRLVAITRRVFIL